MNQPIAIGDAVVIVHSSHADVRNGAEGVVTGRKGHGYTVAIKGNFGLKAKAEIREVWFKASEVRIKPQQHDAKTP